MLEITYYVNQLSVFIKLTGMDFKKTILNLVICLVLSPIVVYIILGIAKLAGSTYEMSHGETFIIWLLMAIMIRLSFAKKAS